MPNIPKGISHMSFLRLPAIDHRQLLLDGKKLCERCRLLLLYHCLNGIFPKFLNFVSDVSVYPELHFSLLVLFHLKL